jgi:gliding motility-associated protein GldM
MSAQDSTKPLQIFVGNKLLDDANGRYVVGATSTGNFTVKGTIQMPQGNSIIERPFSTEYFVMAPSATVAPILVNMFYAGIDNPVRIAVPGAANPNVSATISNGTLTSQGNGIWVAKPRLGSDAVITVTAKMSSSGQTLRMADISFRVRPLPDPTPYLNITNAEGNRERYKGGRPIAKPALVAVDALSAAIDDGILDQPFTVLRFDLVKFDRMGFASTTPSNGANFSPQQKDVIREAQRGQTLLIRGIEVLAPGGGDKRTLNFPMEIRVN